MDRPNTRKPRKILVVDDDPVFALTAQETLARSGFTVQVAGSAADAVALFKQDRPDLVLLDVELPGANGFELCISLRALAPSAEVPIVMVTGHDDTDSVARAFQAGATDFINKPVLWQPLPQRLEFILRAQDAMRALRISEQKNVALLQALPDTLYILGPEGRIIEHISGDQPATSSDCVGKPLEAVFPPDVVRAAKKHMAAADRRVSTCEFVLTRGNERKCFEARFRPQSNGTLLIVVRDTTERQRTEARVKYLAFFDTLTGLPNRQLFVRQARRILRESSGGGLVALLYFDLDRFKRINDNLGHAVGDELLKGVARRLHSSLRNSDENGQPSAAGGRNSTCVARLGGDEFVALLTGLTDEAQATRVADRIRLAIGEPFACAGHRFVVTPSVGIALFPKDASDVGDLLAKADMAMYRAKEQGRNNHAFYGETMAIRSLNRLQLENDLRKALESQEFLIHFQPKVELATSQVVGVEALLRWNHETRGWIAPSTFIPIAEETGIILPLGDWVIRQACRQLREWAGTQLGHLSIAVNVSVQQFARDNFVDSVLEHLAEYNLKPEKLELEITESLLIRSAEDTRARMKRFRAAGLKLAIDDFGTGYSSLGYLRQFPVHALKIDRSFVNDLPHSGDAAAICAAIIAMARELKLQVVAEGVETAQQLDFLQRQGCDQAQGYLLGRPVPASELAQCQLLRGKLSTAESTDSESTHRAAG